MKTVKFPSQGTVFDYYLDPQTRKFLHWNDKVPAFVMEPEASLQVIQQSMKYCSGLASLQGLESYAQTKLFLKVHHPVSSKEEFRLKCSGCVFVIPGSAGTHVRNDSPEVLHGPASGKREAGDVGGECWCWKDSTGGRQNGGPL